ncbi:MAG: DUF2225 domain-containing protein [Clostridiales bacterium]|nr:DUF2225 domain-containing protein [Clostridiales bacterium]
MSDQENGNLVAGIYNKEINCPVCSKAFNVTKVKAKASRVISRDTDFCVTYEGINPLFYDVWICPNCGYAAQQDKFDGISDKEAKIVLQKISPRWTKRSFSGERTVDMAIETFMLALLSLQIRNGRTIDYAKVCLRLAWLYRGKDSEKEQEFLKFAAKHYADTYEKEKFPVDKLDELTCLYMIGELNRRAGNYEESIKWFSRLISSPEGRKNANLLDSARDQFQLAKEAMGVKN